MDFRWTMMLLFSKLKKSWVRLKEFYLNINGSFGGEKKKKMKQKNNNHHYQTTKTHKRISDLRHVIRTPGKFVMSTDTVGVSKGTSTGPDFK